MEINVGYKFPSLCGELAGVISNEYDQIALAYGTVALDGLRDALREVHRISYAMYQEGYVPNNNKSAPIETV